jgi:TatD DNase family protein
MSEISIKPDFIDIHAHVNFQAFNEDREAVVERALSANTWMINVGTQQDTSKSAVELAYKYDKGVYAIVGLHPVHTAPSYHDEKELGEGGKAFTSRGEEFDLEYYRKLASDPKVVGIGECGLDFFHLDDDSIEKQKTAFIKAIELANEVGKPLMLHIRNNATRSAYKEAVEILKLHAKVKGNAHFFAGTWEEAKLFLDMGYTLSFTGAVTYPPKAGMPDYADVIRQTPLNMIMTETDCPYVSPVPYRGKRNEPVYVQEVVKKIAEIKGLPFDEVKKVIVANAFRFFNLERI